MFLQHEALVSLGNRWFPKAVDAWESLMPHVKSAITRSKNHFTGLPGSIPHQEQPHLSADSTPQGNPGQPNPKSRRRSHPRGTKAGDRLRKASTEPGKEAGWLWLSSLAQWTFGELDSQL